jgi:hypothetical protein
MQSIELEREPFESEVQLEMQRREEEQRSMSKKQKIGNAQLQTVVKERFMRIESRMKENDVVMLSLQ